MIKSYLINLDRDQDRLEFFANNFSKHGLEFERISAVDGRTFSDADFRQFTDKRPRQGRGWMRGQMGCFLSHYHAWQKIAAGPDDFCCVFEDDVHTADGIKHLLDSSDWIPEYADIIRLDTSTSRIRLSRKPSFSLKDRNAYRVQSTSWCTGAYIISRRTAERLLEVPEKYHEPSDIFLFNYERSIIAKSLNIFQFYPALCAQDKHMEAGTINFASNIEDVGGDPLNMLECFRHFRARDMAQFIYRSFAGYRRIKFEQ